MNKLLVLDANILIRAALGTRVHELLITYAGIATFTTAEEAFEDAEKYLPAIFTKRGLSKEALQAARAKLELLHRFIQTVPVEVFAHLETSARRRLRNRDEDDWPFLALALLFNCPIWTEDMDFFGCGVATWTSDRVELFLGE